MIINPIFELGKFAFVLQREAWHGVVVRLIWAFGTAVG